MTFSKLFSRISLGLSNTKQTSKRTSTPRRYLYAIGRNSKKFYMTDGCAAVSLKAMRQVADMLNETVTHKAARRSKKLVVSMDNSDSKGLYEKRIKPI